ncbi:MAG: bifunctional glutamate N-acetyltransferase/amino-acid acetyltransferase ArgJ [Nitrospiraceae bacterium]|nr:MAG: bifunctional glutamate N-acetyltransferase/amino-acid acetyltransferase ArgJ [Nitrospiraceae bacterium]
MGRASVIVPGFSFAGLPAGIKKSGAYDLALIFSEKPAALAGVFTTNRIKAAPVRLAIKQISSQRGQAVIVNSGNANACTGTAGYKNAGEMTGLTAKTLGIPSALVYVASTGVIGRPLPMEKIRRAVPLLVKRLSPFDLDKAASAIMTTDTFAKIFTKKIRIGRKTGVIAGIAKGAGMICPDMATMLCFMFTDIAVTPEALDSALREAVRNSFNRISIDNDMSTNDTAMAMANGLLQNTPVAKGSPAYRTFANALRDVAYELAKMIVTDGEGATKLVEITVKGSRTGTDAERVARAVANSMLVKTAIYGRDPNWGRIIAAIGYSGTEVREDRIDIYLNNVRLVRKGTGTKKEPEARELLAEKNISLTIDLGMGTKSAKALTCDLTEKYIKINAHYTT